MIIIKTTQKKDFATNEIQNEIKKIQKTETK